MRLPSHVLTKLYLAGAVGTVGVIALLHPLHQTTSCQPTPVEELATPVEVEPLSEVVRMTHVPSVVVTPLPKPPPQPLPMQPQPQVKPKPKPPRTFASSCGHPVLIDPSKPTMRLPACGRG